MVAACFCFPHSVIGGAFLKAPWTPPKPHTPDRSCGLNGWLSTLYFAFNSDLSLLFSQRGHFPHPSGAGTEVWAMPANGRASTVSKTLMETMVPFLIWIPLRGL